MSDFIAAAASNLFAIIGVLAVAFVLTLWNCDPMLEGLARRLTARRIGLVAYREAWDRVMKQGEA